MKILMVCLGNICRSPLAEGILRSKISENHTVASAGTVSFHEGDSPDNRSIITAKNYGIDISKQKAQYFDKNFFDKFDKIFCMDFKNYQDVISFSASESQKNKVVVILEEAGYDGKTEVPDPYYGTIEDFENVYKMLEKVCDVIVEKYQLK